MSDTKDEISANDQLGQLVERLLRYSDIRRNDPRENREALRDLILGELADELEAVRKAERERCARVCDDEARIRTEAANKHGDDTPEQGRCLAAARAAINCAKGCRYGEQV